MAFNFPSSPAIGDTANGYKWDGTAWIVIGSDGAAGGGDSVNVKDFGAACDGVTDDTAAINLAISSNPGKVIQIPGGTTSVISGPINLLSNMTLRSDGYHKATIKTTSLTADFIRLNLGAANFAHVSIDNLIFAASVPKTAGSVINVMSTGGALYSSKFSNLYWGANIFNGITVGGALYLTLDDISTIDGLGPNAKFISLDGSLSGALVANVNINNCHCIVSAPIPASTLAIGLYLSDRAAGIYSNSLLLEGEGINYDVWMANPSGNSAIAPRDMFFNELICDTAKTRTVNIVKAHNVTFNNSWFGSVLAPGVYLGGGDSNAFSNCNFPAVNGVALVVDAAASHTRICDNTFSGGTIAINIAAGTSDFTIIGNTIRGISSVDAIRVDAGASDRYVIAHNKVDGASAFALNDGGTGTNKTIGPNQFSVFPEQNHHTYASASAKALALGRLGGTTPAFQVDASAASSITGVKVSSGAAGAGASITAIGETNAALKLNSAGTGDLNLNNAGAGAVTVGPGTGSAVFGTEKLNCYGSFGIRTNGTQGAGYWINANVATLFGTFETFYSGNGPTNVGSIQHNGTTLLYSVASDARLKMDNKPVSNARGIVDALKVWDFAWKDSPDKRSIGLYAQEAHDAFPGAITPPQDEKGVWMIDYSKYVPLILQVLQDTLKRVDELETKLLERDV